jgi:hypothetical protein
MLAAVRLLVPDVLLAEQVPVRYTEGVVHGFLVLRSLDGSTLAHGDLSQSASGARVTSHLLFRFTDGSTHEERTLYSQRQAFQLLTHRVVQRGPSFPRPLDMTIDAAKGDVTVRYTDEHGAKKMESEHFDLPPDLANGLVPTLLKNVKAGALPRSIAYVAATPKPRLVKLAISTAGEESFSLGSHSERAMHYVLKVEIGGIAGLVAPLIGKRPPDSHVWVLGGEAPTFMKSEFPLFEGGPVWRIELSSPRYPQAAPGAQPPPPAKPAKRQREPHT